MRAQYVVYLLAFLGFTMIGLTTALTIVGMGLMMPFCIMRIANYIKNGEPLFE